jgi:hypothetical protein
MMAPACPFCFPGGRLLTGNKYSYRLGYMFPDICCSPFFGITPDFADQLRWNGLRIILEHFKQFYKIKPYHRITSYTNCSGLSNPFWVD